MGGLRMCIHDAELPKRSYICYRKQEMLVASEKRLQAVIDSFWNGGELHRFLHRLHLAALHGQVVASLTITEVTPSLAHTLQGSSLSITPGGGWRSAPLRDPCPCTLYLYQCNEVTE